MILEPVIRRYALRMRIWIGLFPLVLTFGCNDANVAAKARDDRLAAASPDAMASLKPEIADVLFEWSKCRNSKLLEMAQEEVSEQDAIKRSFDDCADKEVTFTNTWERVYGKGSAHQVITLKENLSNNAVTLLRRARSDNPLQADNPHAQWGICVGQHLPASIGPQVSANDIVDAAMAACTRELEQSRSDYLKRNAEAVVNANIEGMQQQMRRMALDLVEDRRVAK